MKLAHKTIAVASLVFAAMASGLPTLAATTDPPILIYRFPGVTDDGGALFTGVATAIHCLSTSSVSENLSILVRDNVGTVKANQSIVIFPLQTATLETHGTKLFGGVTVGTGAIQQGEAAIGFTSTSIVCTAMIVDAGSSSPQGIALHGARYNPDPGTLE